MVSHQRAFRLSCFISIAVMLVSVGAVIFFLLSEAGPIDLSREGLQELLESDEVKETLIGVAITVVIGGGAMLFVMRTVNPVQVKNGITAPAKVLKVWDTGTTLNDDPQVGLLLEVSPPSDMPYLAETKTIVSRLRVALIQPGIAAEVKYDPQKPQRLQLLALHIPEGSPTNAVARMEELNELRDKGLITEEEYRRKREEILSGL